MFCKFVIGAKSVIVLILFEIAEEEEEEEEEEAVKREVDCCLVRRIIRTCNNSRIAREIACEVLVSEEDDSR